MRGLGKDSFGANLFSTRYYLSLPIPNNCRGRRQAATQDTMQNKLRLLVSLLPCTALSLALGSSYVTAQATQSTEQTLSTSFHCSIDTPHHEIALAGTISRQDFESYIELPFDVPHGVKRIEVEFDYDRDERTTIDIGLLDPRGFRGWSGGNKRTFFVSANAATPSYNTGVIEAGIWNLLLGLPNVREGVTAAYEATITLSCNATTPVPPNQDRGAGWYVGDLHSHSGHSDGSCNNYDGDSVACPAFMSAQIAADRGLDFIALTEHNAISGHAALAELQAYFPSTLLLAGREITTFFGHANAFGTTEFIDFRLQPSTGYGIRELQSRVAELGALLSINHPGSPTGEDCMGCGWVLGDTDYSSIGAIEVVNTGFVDTPRGRAHIAFWHDKLNRGLRITGIAGSDNHDPSRPLWQPSAIGNPRTWIYSDELSEQALLAGIRRGNVYIDATGGEVTLSDFSVDGAEMGGELSLGLIESTLDVSLRWRSDEKLSVRWVVDGIDLERSLISEETSESFTDNVTAYSATLSMPTATPLWIRMNLINERESTRIVGNPVYFIP